MQLIQCNALSFNVPLFSMLLILTYMHSVRVCARDITFTSVVKTDRNHCVSKKKKNYSKHPAVYCTATTHVE